MALDDERIERVAEAGHAAVHPWERLVTEPLVERCHAAGLLVNVWTSNDPERLVELAALGVDGVCTDVPAIARSALGRLPVASRPAPRLVNPPEVQRRSCRGPASRLPWKDELDGVGHVVELEASGVAECVTVDLVGERVVVFDDEVTDTRRGRRGARPASRRRPGALRRAS